MKHRRSEYVEHQKKLAKLGLVRLKPNKKYDTKKQGLSYRPKSITNEYKNKARNVKGDSKYLLGYQQQ